jgi:hypothetical protein
LKGAQSAGAVVVLGPGPPCPAADRLHFVPSSCSSSLFESVCCLQTARAVLIPAEFGRWHFRLKTWMPGTSSAKTRFALLAGHAEFGRL